MKGFKITNVGLLPEEWQIKRVGEVYDFTTKPRDLNLHTIKNAPFIPMDLIPNGKLFVKDFDIRDVSALSSGTYIENGDLLIAKITPSFENGKQAIVDLPYEFGFATTEVIPVKEKKEISNKFFLFFYLLKTDVRSSLAGKMEGSTGRQRLSKTVLVETFMPLPPFKEQQKISCLLSQIQSAIETQEKIIKTTTELKKALMQKLFSEGLNGERQKETEIGKIPKSWEIVPLEQTGEVIYGIQAAVANLTKPIGTKILTNINITFDGEIDLTHLRYYPLTKPRHFKTLLQKGDILFNWRSGSKDHVGKTAFFDLDGDFTHSSFILRIRTKKEVLNKYLFYYLTYLRSSGYFHKLQNYSVNAKFNASAVNALPTLLPSYDEQTQMAELLDTVDGKLKCSIKKLDFLKSLFKTMLHNLMTGQIRVKDIDFAGVA
jgi:type I restriction enzyme S subunit